MHATSKPAALLVLAGLLSLVLFSCAKTGEEPTPVTLKSLEITPESVVMALGTSDTLEATGVYSDGSTGPIDVRWVSSHPAIAAINSSGNVTALNAGVTTIVARSEADAAVSASADVEVFIPAQLVSISLTPATVKKKVGEVAFFTAVSHYDDSSQQSDPVDWTSSNASVALVNSQGIASAMGAGTTIIKAASKSDPAIFATATMTVIARTGIAVTPATARISLSGSQGFSARVTYTDGSSEAEPVTWSVSNASVAEVNAAGTATPAATGNTNVTATLVQDSTICGSASLTVYTLSSLTVSPATATVSIAGTRSFSASARYSDGVTGTEPVTWSSSNAAVASIDASGTATGAGTGTATITATAVNYGSVSGTASLTVNAFTDLIVGCGSNGIWSIPNAGGGGTLLAPASSFIGGIQGVRTDLNRSSLFVCTQQGTGSTTTAKNLYKVNLSTNQVSLVAANAVTNGLDLHPSGNLIGIEIGSAPNRIKLIDTTTWAQTDFCFNPNLPLDTCVFGSDVLVGSIGGIDRSPQGGTLTQVFTMAGPGGFTFFTSVDDDANGNVYTAEWMTYMVYKLRDLNNDGDFLDSGECVTFATGSEVQHPCELEVDATGTVYIADKDWSNSTSLGIYKVRDTNNDGDGMDAGEYSLWSNVNFQGCAFGGGELTFK